MLSLHTLDQTEVQRGLWPLLTNILGSPPASIPGEEKKAHNTCKLSLHKHRRFLAEELYKGNCHRAKIFSCDSQASCNFPNKAMTLKSMSFQSLIDFHRLMKKYIVYVSGCADIKTG